MTRDKKPTSILLLGPTGVGKTPLGARIARQGLWRRTCVHFDFGANLRDAVERESNGHFLDPEEVDFLERVLRFGALLEDEHFSIAGKILDAFLTRNATCQTVVLLNGLPRHVGQADAMAELVDIRTVIQLRSSDETVLARIRSNVGGDREDRIDDNATLIRNKLSTYRTRTRPLVEYYRHQGVRIITLDVTDTMTSDAMWHELSIRL